MKSDRIFWGLLLIIFGGLFLLQNMGYLSFHFGNLWRLWPLFLIYWGFSSLLKQKDGSTNPALYAVQIAILAVLVYFVVKPKERVSNPHEGLEWQFEEEVDESESGALRQHDFEVPREDVEKASLAIDFGAGSLQLGESTDQLVSVDASTNVGNYAFEHQVKNKQAEISLEHSSKKVTFKNGEFENTVRIAMHPEVLWTLNIETGASECQLDLSDHKVEVLNLSGGASKMDVKMGAPIGLSKVNIETGASKVVLQIPAGATARLVTETGLTDKSISGLNKLSDGTYASAGYNEKAANRYDLVISAGVASIEVKTY